MMHFCIVKNSKMNLSGKWNYKENYSNGTSVGLLIIEHVDDLIMGHIIFSDKVRGETPYMIREFVKGSVKDSRIKLVATEYDIIHSDFELTYELDRWFGTIKTENLILGASLDDQGIEGRFRFERVVS